MSASNPTSRTGIPVVNYYSWTGKEGKIANKVGTEDLVNVPFPLRLLPLDFDATCVENTGFDVKQGIRKVKSNISHPKYQKEITARYDTRLQGETDDQLVVFKGPWYAGAAKTIAHTKAKLHNLTFFMEIGPDKKVILSRLKLHGTASYAFSQARNAAVQEAAARGEIKTQEDFIYTITGAVSVPNNAGTTSFVPTFTWEPLSEKAKALQIEEDIKLQTLFSVYFSERTAPAASPVGTANSAFATPQVQAQPAPVAQAAPPPVEPPVQATPPPPPAPVEDGDLPF